MKRNKYQTNIAPFLQETEQMARDGISEREIADNLGVSYSTFRTYKAKHKELQDTLSKAKEMAEQDAKEDLYEKVKKPPASAFAPAYSNTPPGVKRPDRDGVHRGAFDKAKKRIYATQTVCGICGKPVDFTLKYPHPLSPCIDHIIPVSKGGHPSDMSNLQLAHWTCNRQKSDKLFAVNGQIKRQEQIGNRVLPQSRDWRTYRGA